MDNASKALIMAGAILIAVALVSLGVFLYSKSVQLADTSIAEIDVLDIEMQNSRVNRYCGDRVSYTNVKYLFEYISNAKAAGLPIGDLEFTGITSTDSLVKSKAYSVTATKDTGSGLIVSVAISEK